VRTIVKSRRPWAWVVIAGLALGFGGPRVFGQSPAQPQAPALPGAAAPSDTPTADDRLDQPDEEILKALPDARYKMLTDPEALRKALKDKQKPPLEFFRSQVAPFDVLPFVKPNHWATISLELRANYADYEGLIQTAPVRLGGKQEIVYRRDARLLKGQPTRLGFQAMMPGPNIPRELGMELARPDAIRADELMSANLRTLPVHQMLVLVLAKDTSEYGSPRWNRSHALLPSYGDRDPAGIDQQRYYRLVLPQESDKPPPLSPHPLTWTTISHVIWDGMLPDMIRPDDQQAMLDWLHWGGQLTIIGGVGASIAQLKDSFLGPLLPADTAGQNTLLDQAQLEPIAKAFPRAVWPEDPLDVAAENEVTAMTRRYDPPVSILPAPKRPVYFMGLRPREGAVPIMVQDSDQILGVEGRVGRGRITMLAFNPNDPAIAAWPGFDTLVRRLVLRRPEERLVPQLTAQGAQTNASGFPDQSPGLPPGPFLFLSGPELSWVRYVARDLGAVSSPSPSRPATAEPVLPRDPVAEWNDASLFPSQARLALKAASGITIPHRSFILKVIVAYIIALVPLNWMICRFVLRRREWSWALVPLLALGFAIGVERAAAYDLGFDSGCDEMAVLELQPEYSRAHLSRFAALFSTGRVRYTISFPDDRSALALPMSAGDELRGEETVQSAWQSLPVPALTDFQVQPRSLALYRAEQMVNLPGTIELKTDTRPYQIVNGTDMELRDAEYIDVEGDRRVPLGTIAPGAAVTVPEPGRAAGPPATAGAKPWLDPEPFLKPLRDYRWRRPEDRGEIRLVAWTAKEVPGQMIEPKVDRHRAVTVVVAHLKYGYPPDHDQAAFNALALGPEPDPAPTIESASASEAIRFRARPMPKGGPPVGLIRQGPPRQGPSPVSNAP
jgi:hypothetical protein